MASTPNLVIVSDEKESSVEAEIETSEKVNVGHKIQQTREVHKEYARVEGRPHKPEIVVFFIYGLCSYFIHTVLLPIVFPLIISQILSTPPQPERGWTQSLRGIHCKRQETELYEALVHQSITVKNFNFSSLTWIALSWAAGILVSLPILAGIAFHLDYGNNQILIFAVANVTGALFCLPAGFFKSHWLFAPYTAFIVVASTVASAAHTRHLGLMVRGFTGPIVKKRNFPDRRAVASWLSLCATSAGTLGAAIIAAFTFHMLHHSEKLISLWIVSIFSGLKWLVGICHAFAGNPPGPAHNEAPPNSNSARWIHAFAIFKYPHAAGSVAGVFFSSFASSCIFTGGVLYMVGGLCIKPLFLLTVWLAYFTVPFFSLPLLHPLQLLICADALRMQVFGLLLSAVTSGTGFFFRYSDWKTPHMIAAAVIQGTAAGVLHAFGRVLLLDCSPPGREGAFAVWFVWVRAIGTCVGFAVASAFPDNIGRSLGTAFLAVIAGVVILIFGNISNLGGAVAAGHVKENMSSSEKESPVHPLAKEEGREEKV